MSKPCFPDARGVYRPRPEFVIVRDGIITPDETPFHFNYNEPSRWVLIAVGTGSGLKTWQCARCSVTCWTWTGPPEPCHCSGPAEYRPQSGKQKQDWPK